MIENRRKNQKGMSLIEILVATLITVIAIGGLLQAYRHFNVLAESTEEIGTAIRNLTTMMEKIRSTPITSVETLFPNGTADGGGVNDYETIVEGAGGGYELSNEQITVTYPNPGTNPLEIVITVQWDGPQGRQYIRSLSTFKTD